MNFNHIPVLCKETITALDIKENGIYIDGTLGGGGHSAEILKRLGPDGRLLAIDRDPDACEAASKKLAVYENLIIERGNYSDIKLYAQKNGIEHADGILLDIGVSSFQFDNPERGFSYHSDNDLDMRMSKEGISARDIVNYKTQRELSDIIFQYGEEKSANRIASAIVRYREDKEIETTGELVEIIKSAVPAAVRRKSHPARKTFQGLRIAVNCELDELKDGLEAGFDLLKPDGVFAVITFHSLEDRIVKNKMNEWATGCICPKDFPVCVCGKKPRASVIYKKGKAASKEEIEENPRARSARLRAIKRI